ncbi:MetQ/NlpA family ABC transporter substrate-binding protein [Pollutimonas bauzanensis]|uniref:Lipoprotein n=1 Tax=Pollutimonas bauzanensis TaxID=658167 RepID=A0A1M5SNF4_9BURK|nr:MetQ/NlpA family lipoprotein [Pollutimonas bauzanensis]SHH40025.1 D-methionine transport system substrate-binding protein [Pollutimonas bauzanensis]
MTTHFSQRILGAVLAACALLHAPAFSADQQPLKVGVRGGVDEQIWEVVAQVARKNGLAVEPIVITGTASPNEALNNGDLQANSFQHIPFLRDQVKQRGYKIVAAANTLISPIAFYSTKYKSLKDLPDGAKVGIPNDPSNQTRALVVLRDHGLITLRDGFDPFTGTAALADVTSNPRKLEFVESTSVVLARSLQDVDIAAIVNSFAYQVGLIATRDGIAVEKKENNPYVNIIAVREQDKDAPWVQPLVQAYHSEEVRQFILKKFEGSVIPVF